jgi:ring-1,2-phenylacetyl-CoA epoxidase subunit PaaC
MDYVKQVFQQANLTIPTDVWSFKGGRTGVHTEHMGYLLTEMQYMQRAYPGMEW